MPRTHLLLNRLIHPLHQLGRKVFPRLHQQEQHHALVVIPGAPLPHADAVLDDVRKVRVDDGIDLSGAEADSRRVEDAVCAAEEDDVFGHRVQHDEVAVGPHTGEAREVAVEIALGGVLTGTFG